jgi:hypothetical protein
MSALELAHREELEDAPLDLLEAVVVLVEDRARPRSRRGRLRDLIDHGSSVSQSR